MRRRLRRSWHVLLPALTVLALTIPSIGRGGSGAGWLGFKADDTAWYAAIALQAARVGLPEGDRLRLLTLWGPRAEVVSEKGLVLVAAPYFNKPPLVFWVHSLLLRAAGPKLWAARLPTILAATAAAAVLAWGIGAGVGRRSGATAGVALALTYEFARHTQAISLDMWMALWCAAALSACLVATRKSRPSWLLLAGAAVGLSLLTKPLVGLLALVIIAAWLVWDGRLRLLKWLVAATLVAVAVALPWHLAMALAWGEDFLNAYFGREVAQRAAGSLGNIDRAAGLSFYPRLVVASYWPWLAVALPALWWAMFGRVPDRVRSSVRLLTLSLLGWFIILSVFPDRRPRYLLVAYPAAAGLVGIFLVCGAPAWARRMAMLLRRGCLPVAIVVGIALGAATRGSRPPEQWGALLTWLREDPTRIASLNEGAFSGQRGAVIFLETGRWPAPTRGIPGVTLRTPERGELLIYHRRDGFAPGPGETHVFISGDITVTRLDAPAWSPVPTADRGE